MNIHVFFVVVIVTTPELFTLKKTLPLNILGGGWCYLYETNQYSTIFMLQNKFLEQNNAYS